MQNVLVDDRRIWVDLFVSFPSPTLVASTKLLSTSSFLPALNPSRKWEAPGAQQLPPSVVVDAEKAEVVEEEEEDAVDLEDETISSRLLDSGTRDTEDQGKVHPWGWFSTTEEVGVVEEDRRLLRRFVEGRRERGRGSPREVVEEEEEDETSEVEGEGMVGGGEVGVGVLRGGIQGITGIEMTGGIGSERGNEEEEEGTGRVIGIETEIGDDVHVSLQQHILGAD